jgi:two-component system, LytTR family, response regulator
MMRDDARLPLNVVLYEEETPRDKHRGMSRIAVNLGQKVLYIRTEELDWVAAEDNYVRLHVHGKTYLLRETLGAFVRKLDARLFFRTHRSYVVNLERVQELHPFFKGEAIVVLSDGGRIPISKGKVASLKKCLEEGL